METPEISIIQIGFGENVFLVVVLVVMELLILSGTHDNIHIL